MKMHANFFCKVAHVGWLFDHFIKRTQLGNDDGLDVMIDEADGEEAFVFDDTRTYEDGLFVSLVPDVGNQDVASFEV